MGQAITQAKLRAIPAVEKVLQALGEIDMPRPAVIAVVRRELAALRGQRQIPGHDEIFARIRASLDTLRRARIQPLINGTGILVHTNFGRAPLGPAVVETLQTIAANYNNLEYDLTGGERGGRAAYLEHNLALLCSAEAATVVNNCAAALVVVLRHFTAGERKEVIISRGELIQIGGGFRIPEILEASSAKLREIGTTNKTSINDYAKAIGKQTAMILKVHRSNFFMGGFVDSPPTEKIAALARKKRVPFVEDLGSGAVVETEKLSVLPASCWQENLPAGSRQHVALEHEPTPAEVLKRGVDLVTFSGDKLLGGPQAGIIAGKAKLVAALKREPFFRAVRCDKLILAALQTVVDGYLAAQVGRVTPCAPLDQPGPIDGAHGVTRPTLTPQLQLPVLAMLRISNDELIARAEKIVAALAGSALPAQVGKGNAQVGGGSLPQSVIPSVTIDLMPQSISLPDFAAQLRAHTPPVIGYISGGRFKLDLRTIFPRQDEEVLRAIRSIMTK